MHNLTIAEIIRGLRAKTFSSEDITRHYLERIKSLDTAYNSFITVTEAQAIASAKAADLRLAEGDAHPLCGVPFAHKDIFCTDGVKTTCGSKMLDNFVPPYNATVVQNYLDAGAVMLGKTNMDEFAMGSSNETSYFGPVKNPWNTSCVPGGSSGGSAAAVAARMAPAATATDTGGSIRQPAALCGITGIKPTYGRVSRWGMIAFASSLDQAGVMTRTAEDAAIMLNVMASFDSKDSTCVDEPLSDYTATLNDSLEGVTIGVPQEYFGEGLNPGTQSAVEAAIKEYEKAGATIKSISLPHSHLAVPAYYVIAPANVPRIYRASMVYVTAIAVITQKT
jgi:aspartyl/glutamyl-tRNA(Asn/Gln) amidotransferase subunit A (EC 6.3.5.-)